MLKNVFKKKVKFVAKKYKIWYNKSIKKEVGTMTKVVISTEYILLGQFLKFSGIISNGGEAKNFLENEDVFVNNSLEKRRGRKLFLGDFVTVNGEEFLIIDESYENQEIKNKKR